MKTLVICILALHCVAATGFAQTKQPVKPTVPASPKAVKGKTAIPLPAGRTIAPVAKPAAVYADSVKFKSVFAELYTLVRPQTTIRERTEQEFKRFSRTFKARGVDSSIAYEHVMKAIDPAMDEKLIFKAYRQEFTADQLKDVVGFFKTTAGQKFLTVQPKLVAAQNLSIAQYVSNTVSSVISPMMKPLEKPTGMTQMRVDSPATNAMPRPGIDSAMKPTPTPPKPTTK